MCYKGKELISSGRDALEFCKVGEQYTQREKHEIHKNQGDSEQHHVLLRIFKLAHREVLLHHVLVQSRHGNSDKHTAEHLFPAGFRSPTLEKVPIFVRSEVL